MGLYAAEQWPDRALATARTRDGGHVHDALRNDGQDMMVLAARGATLNGGGCQGGAEMVRDARSGPDERKAPAAGLGLAVERVTRIELAP